MQVFRSEFSQMHSICKNHSKNQPCIVAILGTLDTKLRCKKQGKRKLKTKGYVESRIF